jgi:protein TonB
MFDVLLASGAHLEIRPRWVTYSLTTHALVLTLAVLATQAALQAPRDLASEAAVMVFVPKPPPPPPPPEPVTPEPPPAAVVAEPPPKGFQTVVALKEIPNVVPPVDLTERALDPRDFTGRGVEGGIATGVVGGTGRVETSVAGGPGAIYEATTADDRYEPAVVVSQPVPRYPRALESLGLEGRVVVEFIVDTLGGVEPSVRVLQSSHDQFEAAALETVRQSLFRAARLGGHPVRQRTRQAIRFVTAR